MGVFCLFSFYPYLFAFLVEKLPWEQRKLLRWKMCTVTPNIVKQTIVRSHFRVSKSKLWEAGSIQHVISSHISSLWTREGRLPVKSRAGTIQVQCCRMLHSHFCLSDLAGSDLPVRLSLAWTTRTYSWIVRS